MKFQPILTSALLAVSLLAGGTTAYAYSPVYDHPHTHRGDHGSHQHRDRHHRHGYRHRDHERDHRHHRRGHHRGHQRKRDAWILRGHRHSHAPYYPSDVWGLTLIFRD